MAQGSRSLERACFAHGQHKERAWCVGRQITGFSSFVWVLLFWRIRRLDRVRRDRLTSSSPVNNRESTSFVSPTRKRLGFALCLDSISQLISIMLSPSYCNQSRTAEIKAPNSLEYKKCVRYDSASWATSRTSRGPIPTTRVSIPRVGSAV